MSKKALSEKALIEKAKSGDKNSLEVLLYDNYKIVYGYLLKLTMNEEITKDITQEVMVKAILNIKKFKGNSKFSTWLISIASNIYKDMLKKNKKISSLDIEKTLIKNTKSLEDDIINKETIRKIWEVLLKLPEEKRMVFILKNHFNYSYREISKILKCPVGTVRSRLHYCIKKIRDLTLKEGDIQVDERIIAAAFREAEKIKEKNKNIKDYIVFALISVILLSSAGISAYMGYGRIILTIQIFIIIFVPILIPFFIMHRLSKEVDL